MAGLLQLEQRRLGVSKARADAVKISGKAAAPGARRAEPVCRRPGRWHGPCSPISAVIARKMRRGLGLFLFDQPYQLVVLLDGLERLQVDRLPAGAGAMDHAGNAPLMLRLYRYDETLPAYGDQIFLGAAAFAESAQGAAQALFDHTLLALDLPADPAQIGRSVVAERAIGVQARAEGTRR